MRARRTRGHTCGGRARTRDPGRRRRTLETVSESAPETSPDAAPWAREPHVALERSVQYAPGRSRWARWGWRSRSVRPAELFEVEGHILAHACIAEEEAQAAVAALGECAPQLRDPAAERTLTQRLGEVAHLCVDSSRLLRGTYGAEAGAVAEAQRAATHARATAWAEIEGLRAVAAEARALAAQISGSTEGLSDELRASAAVLRKHITAPQREAREATSGAPEPWIGEQAPPRPERLVASRPVGTRAPRIYQLLPLPLADLVIVTLSSSAALALLILGVLTQSSSLERGALLMVLALPAAILGAGWGSRQLRLRWEVRTADLEEADQHILSHAHEAAQQARSDLLWLARSEHTPAHAPAPESIDERLGEITSLCAESTAAHTGRTEGWLWRRQRIPASRTAAKRAEAWAEVCALRTLASRAAHARAEILWHQEGRAAALGEEELLVRAAELELQSASPGLRAGEEAERLERIGDALEEIEGRGGESGEESGGA